MKIVEMTSKHIQDIENIERSCFSTPWTFKQIEEEFYNKYSIFIVFENEFGVAVGYISCQIAVDIAYIINIAVLPQYRNQKIAKELIKSLHKRVLKYNVDFVSLEVRQSNKIAIDLYSKLGYENVGKRKNFYKNPKEDGLIMTYKIDNIKKGENNENTCNRELL